MTLPSSCFSNAHFLGLKHRSNHRQEMADPPKTAYSLARRFVHYLNAPTRHHLLRYAARKQTGNVKRQSSFQKAMWRMLWNPMTSMAVLRRQKPVMMQKLNWLKMWCRHKKNHQKLAVWWWPTEAQYNVGMYYLKEPAVVQDRKKALLWFKKSAAQGYEDAKAVLSVLAER